jgi:hypothetical protein
VFPFRCLASLSRVRLPTRILSSSTHPTTTFPTRFAEMSSPAPTDDDDRSSSPQPAHHQRSAGSEEPPSSPVAKRVQKEEDEDEEEADAVLRTDSSKRVRLYIT